MVVRAIELLGSKIQEARHRAIDTAKKNIPELLEVYTKPPLDLPTRIIQHLQTHEFTLEPNEVERDLLYESGIEVRKWVEKNAQKTLATSEDNWNLEWYSEEGEIHKYHIFADIPKSDALPGTGKVKFGIGFANSKTQQAMSLEVMGDKDSTATIQVNYTQNEDVYRATSTFSEMPREDARFGLVVMADFITHVIHNNKRKPTISTDPTIFQWHKRVRELYRNE